MIAVQQSLFMKPIDSLDHCDGCRAPVSHVTAAPCSVACRWVALCRVCAGVRGLPWLVRDERKVPKR